MKEETQITAPRDKIQTSCRTVLSIGPFPPPRGGISIHIQRLSREFRTRGLQYVVLDEARAPTKNIANLRQISAATYVKYLRGADLVHIHTSNRYVRLLHTILARALGRSVLHTVHGHDRRRLPRLCLRLACYLGHERIAVSEAVKKEVGLPCKVIPAFIGPSSADEVLPHEMEVWIGGRKSAGRRVIAMNAFRPMKLEGVDLYGIDMMLEVLMRSEFRGKFAAMICVANIKQDKEYYEELQRQITTMELHSDVKLMTGSIEFSAVLSRSDIFIRPTITDGDSVSIREALWYGIPTIASDAAVRPEGVVTFKKRDLNDLANVLASVADASRSVPQRPGYGAQVVDISERLLAGKEDN